MAPDVRQITSTHFLSLSGRPVKLENDGLQHQLLRSRIIFLAVLDLTRPDPPAVLLRACNTRYITSEAKLLRHHRVADGLRLAPFQLF